MEHWNLDLRKEYQVAQWPWPSTSWDSVGEAELAELPNANGDLLRYCPDDGTAAISQVPAGLPREWPNCHTQMAIFHDDHSVYAFVAAYRPKHPLPGLADNTDEDFGLYFASNGLHRGIYFGLNQNNECICLPKVWDPELQEDEDYDDFPWSQFRTDQWQPLDLDYEARVLQLSEGIAACWRIGKPVIRDGLENGRLGFTAGRRCFATGELVSWGSNLMWETRHDELGYLKFVDQPQEPPVPTVDRIDVHYSPADESGRFAVRWRGVWDKERLARVPEGTHYSEYLRRYTIALNGQEHTSDIGSGTELEFPVADGWNRLEVMTAVGEPGVAVSFQKFSGNRIVPGIHVQGPEMPEKEELVDAFRQWSAEDADEYIAPGTWGTKGSDPAGLCLDHHGSFRMEPYALACQFLESTPDYESKVRETCDRILEHEQEGHWFPCLCIDPMATMPFAGGAFGHGAVCEALVLGYRVLGDPECLDAAVRAVNAYDLYPLEHNQNYAAFALWHLSELYSVTADSAVLERAEYYLQFAGHHIDMSGAQRGHNYYSAYGGITLKGLAKLQAAMEPGHPGHAGLRDKVLRYTNQMLARQQQTGFFAERNRKYLGYHTLTPFAGLVEAALAGGDEIFNQLLPSLLAAYEAQRDKPEGLVIASMARLVHKR